MMAVGVAVAVAMIIIIAMIKAIVRIVKVVIVVVCSRNQIATSLKEGTQLSGITGQGNDRTINQSANQ